MCLRGPHGLPFYATLLVLGSLGALTAWVLKEGPRGERPLLWLMVGLLGWLLAGIGAILFSFGI